MDEQMLRRCGNEESEAVDEGRVVWNVAGIRDAKFQVGGYI